MRALSDKELQLILCVCLLSLLPVCLTDWNRWARMGAGSEESFYQVLCMDTVVYVLYGIYGV